MGRPAPKGKPGSASSRTAPPGSGTPTGSKNGPSAPKGHEPPASNLPVIVGIGASAGGLDALKRFFAAVPAGTDLSFVVVMHLDPSRKSMLDEIIARTTRLNVCHAEDGMAPEPETVYIAPPRQKITIRDGQFHLEEPQSPESLYHQIDTFFDSLAAELGQRAIALVFSGTGSDGSRGARAVKDAGGTVLVQDEATAVYPDMPRGVIAAGAADQSLPVEKMPEQIMALACPSFAATGLSTRPADVDEMLGAIFRIVKGSTGHDFSNYKVSTVLRRIERRMAATGLTGLDGYRDLLEENTGEAHLLCQEMLIGVTSFFRDPDAFELLRARVFPRLFADRAPDDPVRIWHASCSTGEEVYSMAILVREYLDDRKLDCPVQFFATDIDERAIVQARSGLYPPDIEADLGPERLQRFFVATETGYRVAKPLREMIVFAPHSLVKDPPFSRLDLLVCRNFLIYLKSDMQQRLIALFHLALKPGGILFLGSSETVGRSTDLFTPVDAAWKVYERQQGDRKAETSMPFGYVHARLVGAALPHRPAAEDIPPGAMVEKQLLERYSPPCVVVNDKYEVVYVSTRTDPFLEVPVGTPTHDLLKMARKELRPLLRSAIHKAFDEQKQVVFRGVRCDGSGCETTVNLLVEPLGAVPPARKLAMVVFEAAAGQSPPAELPGRDDAEAIRDESAKDLLIRQLEEQLFISHEQLQATIEQLESANEGLMSTNEELLSINEEFQSTNEELHSTNEELETSREELQALNEELVTVNAELQQKVEALDQANSDMENLLASSEIATIFLDRQLRVKRFTPTMAELFHLLPGDADRPFRHLAGLIDWPGLDQEMESVLAGEPPVEREVATRKATRHFLARLLPYRTSEGEIGGVVLTLIDITERKRLEARTVHLASFPRINPNPVMEIDLKGGINYFNPAITNILDSLGLDGQDAAPFLPGDLDRLIEAWDRTTEATHLREVVIGDRIFAATVHLAPQFEVVRIYAYDATDRKRAEEKTARQNALLNGINLILEAALDSGTEEDLGGRCLAVAEEITGSRFGFIGEIGDDGLLHDIAVSDPGWELCAMHDRSGERRAPGSFHIHGVYGRVLLDGEGFFTNDPASHPDSIGLPAGHPPLKAFLGAALIRDGGTFGMIALGNRNGGYSTTELEDLQTLAPVIVEAFQRKRGESALRQSEAKYRRALDTMLEGCQVIGFDWRYLYLNGTAEKHNRRPSTELLGRTVMECWPGFTETQVFALEKSCMEDRVTHQLDNEFTFPDGHVGWFRLIIQPVAEGIAIYSEDISERKLAEQALQESEERVRRKLDSILTPEGDTGELELADIIDTRSLQHLVDDFYKLSGMPMGLIDLKGKVLVGVGWQKICMKFHRVNPETCKNCVESDTLLSAGVPPGEYKIYKCKNNLWDVATPIMVGGKHLGNLFMGQFFFEDEPLDFDFFRSQARRYGFDEEEYIECIREAPRLSREKLDTSMAFFMRLAGILSKLGYSNLKLARTLAEGDALTKSLREQEEMYSAIVNNAADGIVLVDPESLRFVEFNDAACTGLGFSREEFAAMTLRDVHAPATASEFALNIHKGDSARISHQKDHRHLHKNGTLRDVRVSSRFVTVKGNRYLLSIWHDITELKRVEQEREKAARLESLGLLAGGIAHDFNNILTAVIGNISLARTKIGEEHAATRQLASCETALDKATYLTRQLLTFSRGGEPVRGSVDTQQLIREVVTFSLHGSNCKEIMDLPPDLWHLDADSGQIHQALNNMIINAVHAMPNGGVFSLSAANEELAAGNPHDLPAGRYVKLTLADQGSGIPPDILPKIFDPYFTTKPTGTGLGLASVFSIVKRHDGAIEVASLPGRGTTFTLHLPATDVSGRERQTRQEMPELPTAPADGASVLVMDDEEMIRSLAEAMLDKLGYRAATCSDGAEAVACYRRALEEGTPFSLVILDMTVPGGMGGKEAAEQIRAIDPGAKLVISTGYAVDSVYQGDNDPMFQGTVSKPYNINQLALELARLTTRSD